MMNTTESYQQTEKLIHHTCHCFQRQWGGNYEDLLSEANQGFIEAMKGFDPSRGKLSKRVRFVVWKRLKHASAREFKRNALNKAIRDEKTLREVQQPKTFNLEKLMKEVSPDAAKLIKLVVDPPADIKLKKQKVKGQSKWYYIHSFLREIGWSISRITESFNEIQEALQS